MQVSRELDYSVRAMVVLAANEGQVLSKKNIADGFDIPVNFLAIILPRLVHEGLVDSLPGPRGGYRLAKPANRISMYDVIAAMGRNFLLNRCLNEVNPCEQKSRCPVSSVWVKIQGDMETYLQSVTFDKLASEFK